MKIAPRRVRLVLVTLAAGVLIAACGSASSSSSTTSASGGGSAASAGSANSASATGSSSSSSRAARRAQLVACLKQHGVTPPSRGTGTGTSTGTGTTPRPGFFGGAGGYFSNPQVRAAMQACGARFGFRGGQGFRGRISHTRINNYVACVRKNGYSTMPNPNFSGKGPIFPANIRSDPKFQAASAKCQSLLVPPRGTGSGGASTTAGA